MVKQVIDFSQEELAGTTTLGTFHSLLKLAQEYGPDFEEASFVFDSPDGEIEVTIKRI